MLTRIKHIWQTVNASYWFYPALFTIAAVLCAFATIWLDRNGYAEFLNDVAWIQQARPQGASNMLTVIAGSMIGVASTVFSITIAAVAYASGNYGPRLLTNFMENRGNQLSLATFIGTFAFSITVLRVVRARDEAGFLQDTDPMSGFVPQLSLLVAYILAALSVAVLVYFLNHIPASIRINTVLHGIGARLLKDIETDFPAANDGSSNPNSPGGTPIHAHETGYVQLITFRELEEVAAKENGTLKLAVRTGDFVHPDVPLAYWAEMDAVEETPDDAVRDCFTLGSMRTPNQDMEFLIDELVEIALRALSPGINDPFTAITALHWLGAATAELGRRKLVRSYARKNEQPRVQLLDNDFEHYVNRGFGAVRGGVATNRIAAQVAFDAMHDAATTLDDESRRALIVREAHQLVRQAREHLAGPELEEVEARYQSFRIRIER